MKLGEYAKRKREEISKMEKELLIYEASGLEISIVKDRWDKKEVLVPNYELATDYTLRRGCGCCNDSPLMVDFIVKMETPHGAFKAYARQAKDPRHAIFYTDFGCIPENAEENLEKIARFYREKKVPEELLRKFEKSVKYMIETGREEDSEDVVKCMMGGC